jgi:hypothetical protein
MARMSFASNFPMFLLSASRAFQPVAMALREASQGKRQQAAKDIVRSFCSLEHLTS